MWALTRKERARPRSNNSGKRILALGVIAGLVPVLAGTGCASLTGEDEVNQPERVTDREQGSGYPNLASVPDSAPEVTPLAEREALLEALANDRSKARYSDEPLRPANVDGLSMAPASDDALGSDARSESALPDGGSGVSDSPLTGETRPRGGDRAGDIQLAQASGKADSVIDPAGFVRDGRLTMIAVIYFGHAAVQLDNADRTVLRQVADLQKARGGRLVLHGHASQRTRTSQANEHRLANFETSFDRAANVGDYLTARGVDPDDIVAVARGSEEPVYYEFMPTGEAGNRRVEIYLEQ